MLSFSPLGWYCKDTKGRGQLFFAQKKLPQLQQFINRLNRQKLAMVVIFDTDRYFFHLVF